MARFFDGTKRSPDEFAAEAYRLFKAGKSFEQISMILGLKREVVAAMVESLPAFDRDKDEAWRLLRSGKNFEEIGAALGLTYETAQLFAYTSNAKKKEYAEEAAATADAKRRAAFRAMEEAARIKLLCSDSFVFKSGGMLLFDDRIKVSIGEANRVRKEKGVEPVRQPPTLADIARARTLLEAAGYIVTATDRVAGPPPKPEPKPIFACWNPEHRHQTAAVADRCNARRAAIDPLKFKRWTRQEKFEALRLHGAGATFAAIGEKFGVSAGSARGAVGWALWQERERSNS